MESELQPSFSGQYPEKLQYVVYLRDYFTLSMKKYSILMLILVQIAMQSNAQTSRDGVIYRGNQKFLNTLDIGLGYIFDNKYEKYTLSTSVNNFIGQRYGMFVMVELNPPSPAIVMGPTITIYDFAYIYGGIDFFTTRGYFQRGGFKHARKDLGIGIYPFRWGVIKLCHSFNAGSRVELGIRIPLEREIRYNRRLR